VVTLLRLLWILTVYLVMVSCEIEDDYCITTEMTVWNEQTQTYITVVESYCEYY
jgi:hypothetical protein